ncbi:hypothetical protein H6P81_011000 [Aristolochia fimbriata]|uniref:Uncharacterized protein n=1 Tax=Aristolochia fimbriata TaxID=158543 RepID=A0AAV7EQC0_ARIFI|nr:hypothetical protein H6P81_011000 [Aristolochia fimbriata]
MPGSCYHDVRLNQTPYGLFILISNYFFLGDLYQKHTNRFHLDEPIKPGNPGWVERIRADGARVAGHNRAAHANPRGALNRKDISNTWRASEARQQLIFRRAVSPQGLRHQLR